MKTTKTFENASLISVVNGVITIKSAAGIEHTFTNASVVSVNNGTIIIETEWTPKKGELVKITGNYIDAYSIFHTQDKPNGIIVVYGYKRINSKNHSFCRDYWFEGSQTEIHPVTPAEQQAFDDFCKSQGKIWNKEKLQWERYKWKPLYGETYYCVNVLALTSVVSHTWKNDTVDNTYYRTNNCFETREEAEAKLEQINKLLLEV